MADGLTSDEVERKKDLSNRLESLGIEQEERVAEHIAKQLTLPYVNLTMFPVDSDAIQLIPHKTAEDVQVVLFYRKGKDIRMAAIHPQEPEVSGLVESLAKDLGHKPEMYVMSKRSLRSVLDRYPKEVIENRAPDGELRVDTEEEEAGQDVVQGLEELGKRITSLPPTEILQSIIVHAVHMGASDVHIEPGEKLARLRFRVDGVLQDITSFARDGWALILSRIKVLSHLKLNVRETPQDGSFVLRLPDEIYDVRVSVLPGGQGENIVMRLLNRKTQAIAVTELGMKKRDFEVVTRELERVNGMILVTGPTGSGKTTTLASFVTRANTPELKIITLEDPIEYRLPGVEQTQIDVSAGYTFPQGLRSILRQDPDMILVGEMRDDQTVETSIHASLTGHLVFTTLHTNNAAGAIPRLVNMGAKPNVLAPALNMIIAQRLVRVVCKKCAEEYAPTAPERDHIMEAMQGVRADMFSPKELKGRGLKLLRAKGCKACIGGYKGRVGVFEIFQVDQIIENLIIEGGDENRIQDAALAQGMTTIAQDAYLKVLDQVTTIEEVERISEE